MTATLGSTWPRARRSVLEPGRAGSDRRRGSPSRFPRDTRASSSRAPASPHDTGSASSTRPGSSTRATGERSASCSSTRIARFHSWSSRGCASPSSSLHRSRPFAWSRSRSSLSASAAAAGSGRRRADAGARAEDPCLRDPALARAASARSPREGWKCGVASPRRRSEGGGESRSRAATRAVGRDRAVSRRSRDTPRRPGGDRRLHRARTWCDPEARRARHLRGRRHGLARGRRIAATTRCAVIARSCMRELETVTLHPPITRFLQRWQTRRSGGLPRGDVGPVAADRLTRSRPHSDHHRVSLSSLRSQWVVGWGAPRESRSQRFPPRFRARSADTRNASASSSSGSGESAGCSPAPAWASAAREQPVGEPRIARK